MLASMSREVLLTEEGAEKLRQELEELKGPTRARNADAIREAKAHGDLRENAAYHEAKLNQRRLDSRIAELEKALQLGKIVSRPVGQTSGAHLGNTVTLEDVEFGDEFDVRIVGSFEADPAMNHISITSPLGEALVGKDVGDQIEVEAPGGTSNYKIKSVS